jgi:hypothetical protein
MFTKFLSDFAGGLFADTGYLRDYQHASRLYVDSAYGMAPKAGWSYFIEIGLNPAMGQGAKGPFKFINEEWYTKSKGKLGLVAKSADLPRFTIGHETINQYNKKTVIQNKITYNPITITFHDDMGNMTTNLWKNYYQYYYADSKYPTTFSGGATGRTAKIPSAYNMDAAHNYYAMHGSGSGGFPNSAKTFSYGLNNQQSVPFFSYITIFLLNKQKYSSVTLINPIITEWSHSQLDNTSPNKMLENKMTVAYEAVFYNTFQNRITKTEPGFNKDLPYDPTKSPLRAGKGGGLSGLLSGSGDLLDSVADGIENGFSVGDLIGIAKQSKQLAQNYKDVKNAGRAGLEREAYSIASSTLSDAASGRGAYADTNSDGRKNVLNTPINTTFSYQYTNVTEGTPGFGTTVTKQMTYAQAFGDVVKSIGKPGVSLK